MIDLIPLSFCYYCRFAALLFVCFIAVACSNSSTDSGSGVPIKDREIVIEELSFDQQEYFEGEWVTVTLNATGDGVQNLNFDWSVGDGIDFEGQNTGTIRFIAPEVTGAGSVSIRVDLSLNDGNLVGAQSQQGSVTILDTDPPNIVSAGFTTDLVEVEQLNMKGISGDLTVATYERFPTDVNGQSAEVQRVQKYSAKLHDSENQSTLMLCGGGSEALKTAAMGPVASDFGCAEALWQERYYQSGNLFRVEKRCDGRVVYARNYAQSDASKAIVSVDEDDFGLLQNHGEVCLNIVETLVSFYDETIQSPMKYFTGEHTKLLMEVSQPEGPIVFELTGDSAVGRFEGFFINSSVVTQNTNRVTVATPQNGQIEQLRATTGSVLVSNLELGRYEIEWDLTFGSDAAAQYGLKANAGIDVPKIKY